MKWSEYKYTETKEKACHHCRVLKVKCDKQRPCGRCTRKRMDCIEFDKNLVKGTSPKSKQQLQAKLKEQHMQEIQLERQKTQQNLSQSTQPTTASTSTSTTTTVDQVSDDLMRTAEEIRKLQEELEALKSQNDHLRQQIELSEEIPRFNFSVDLWNPPVDLQKPILIWETTNMNAIGCNLAFRTWTGYNLNTVQSNFSSFRLISPQTRFLWDTIMRWMLTSGLRLLKRQTIIYCENGVEKCALVTNRVTRSFVWSEIEPIDYVCDETIIDDCLMKKTYMLPVEQRYKVMNSITPKVSLIRLLDMLLRVKCKSVYSDQAAHQQQVLLGLKQQLLGSSLSTIPASTSPIVSVTSTDSHTSPPDEMENTNGVTFAMQRTPPNLSPSSSTSPLRNTYSTSHTLPIPQPQLYQQQQQKQKEVADDSPLFFDQQGVPRFTSVLPCIEASPIFEETIKHSISPPATTLSFRQLLDDPSSTWTHEQFSSGGRTSTSTAKPAVYQSPRAQRQVYPYPPIHTTSTRNDKRHF